MKKKDQAHTFSIMRKPIKVDGEDVRMSPAQLYHRLLCIASTNGPPDPCIFSSEMTAVSPALFTEDGSMRTSQKSQLAKHIVGKDPNITRKQYDNSTGRVYDGCALIHRLAWPKVGTMGCICETFVGYVLASAAPDVQVCVVFDCYDQLTTKAPEQKRRRLKTGSYPDVVLEDNTPVPGNKEAFLGNMANTQHLICMLSAHLEHGGVVVIHAAEEGGADVAIVHKAIELVEHEDVVIIAYDTDILVLVVYHAHSSHQFYMETKHHTIAIDTALQALCVGVCRSLLFVHAMTGCDTTSAMFGIGKMKAFKVLKA